MDTHNLIPGLYMDTTYHKEYPVNMKLTDGVPDDFRHIINEHWSSYPPANPLVAHFFGVLYFIMFIINFFGNGLVVFIFLKVKTLRTPSNIFIVNLAFSDWLMMITQGPPVFITVFLSRFWAFGNFGCKLYGFTGALFGLGSILTMVFIGYDRYNVIVKGMTGTKITIGKALLMVMFIWTYAAGTSLPALLEVWGSFAAEGLLITCSYNYLADDWSNISFVMFAFFFNFCVPMSCIIFFYSSIVKAVVSHERALKAQAKKMNVDSLRSGGTSAESAEIKIAKVAITNVSLWIAIWSPYTVVVLTAVTGNKSSITPLAAQIPSLLTKAASCLNPIVFAVSHPKYREALGTEVPCLGINEVVAKADAQTTNTAAPA